MPPPLLLLRVLSHIALAYEHGTAIRLHYAACQYASASVNTGVVAAEGSGSSTLSGVNRLSARGAAGLEALLELELSCQPVWSRVQDEP